MIVQKELVDVENAASVARWVSRLTMPMTSETRRLAGYKIEKTISEN